MTTLKEAAQAALKALERADKIAGHANNASTIKALKGAIDAEQKAEPVACQPAAIPPGYKLVPLEPTREMLTAWIKADVVSNRTAPDLYRAMLAAAPDTGMPASERKSLSAERIEELDRGGVFGCNPHELVRRLEEERGVFKTRPLTDEQIAEIVENYSLNVGDWTRNGTSVARAIERTHGITGEQK